MSRTARELRRKAFDALQTTWPVLLTLHLTISAVSWLAGQLSGIPLISTIVTFLLCIPNLGILNGTLNHLRGKLLDYSCITSMFPCWTKVICYELWSMLFLFLWMLPGIILSFIGFSMGVFAADASVNTAGALVLFAGIAALFVLLIRASLNYMMASCLIVDTPDMGGIAALEKSKSMMKGNRWRFIRMGLPVFLVYTVIVIIVSALTNAQEPTLLSTLLSSLLTTGYALAISFFQPVFYRDLLGED